MAGTDPASGATRQDPNGTAAEMPPSARAGLRGERRVVTALFCDVVNSTALAEQLDPEDWAEIMNGVFQRLSAPVLRYEGTVARLLGDALLAFFGMAVAHEDDPNRAVLAALGMMQAAAALRAEMHRLHGIDLQVRIGINTGPVVVADVGSPEAMERTALGDAVNVAARMEQTAAPGTIQLSGDTQRFVAALFDLEPLGAIELKGKAEKVAAFRVLGPKAHPDHLRGLGPLAAPLVGRDHELGLLHAALERLREGRGGIVGLIGEAGLGKSRLLSEAKSRWESFAAGRWEAMTAIPYDAMRPFALFQNYARNSLGIELDDTAEVIHDKVVTYIRRSGGDDEAVALCSVAFERIIAAKELHEGKSFPPEVVKQDIYDNILPGMMRTSERVATVVVADDLQWADQASVDLMLHVLQLVEEVPLLVIFAMRPERQAPAWVVKQRAETDLPHRYTEIVLKPLETEDADALVSELLSIADLPVELRRLILRKADGNPYFVEEIVRTLVDQGVVTRSADGMHWAASARVEDIAIPDNLQALLMARIDRLDRDTRATLQMAAVIGRSFYYRILQAISDSAMALDKQLGSLERFELLRECGRRPELEYMFRHELTRDAAYHTILNRRRRELHQRVGEAIEAIFADRIEEHAHRLAQHFDLAGVPEKALKYYELAGDFAASVHAPTESASHYGHALDAARRLGAAEAVTRLEAKHAAQSAPAAA